MAYTTNLWLEKFEVKKPDYDLKERKNVGMKDASFSPARYVQKGGEWVPKQLARRLFGKKDSVRIMFIGDITCFEKQFDEARQGENYDFSYEFDKVRPIFAGADLVVGNLETMIFPDAPYRNEKYVSEQNFHCNAPIEFLDAVRTAGIDVVTNANNHDMDTGAVGIGETIDRIEKFGLIQTGTFNSDKKRYELINVDGFRIAIMAFATEHNNKRCNLTKEGVEFLLNDYSREKAQTIHDQARAEGAELVFVCIHWGKENKTVHNSEQEKIANELAEMGYDCIIGSHPHVLQDYNTIITSDLKKVPVFYSMGNFLSHNTVGPKCRSVIACVDLTRSGQNVNIACSYIPIATSKNCGKRKYVVVPIPRCPLDPRNLRRRQQISEILGEKIDYTPDFRVPETPERIEELPPAKRPKPNLAKVKKFPILYDDGKFVYSVTEAEATIAGISPECTTSSYSVPATILNLPVVRIKSGAFEGCKTLMKINFSKSLSAIGKRACKDCKLLEGFQLGSKITIIKEEAFSGCERLSAAVMRNKVTTIESKAFQGCTSLRSVKLPSSVTKIADDAFEGCPNAVFYCEKHSYGLQYAKEHGFKSVIMELE